MFIESFFNINLVSIYVYQPPYKHRYTDIAIFNCSIIFYCVRVKIKMQALFS